MKYPAGALFLELGGDVKHGFTRGNHIVHKYQVFAGDIVTEELVRFNRITTVDYHRIVTAFVEHTDI